MIRKIQSRSFFKLICSKQQRVKRSFYHSSNAILITALQRCCRNCRMEFLGFIKNVISVCILYYIRVFFLHGGKESHHIVKMVLLIFLLNIQARKELMSLILIINRNFAADVRINKSALTLLRRQVNIHQKMLKTRTPGVFNVVHLTKFAKVNPIEVLIS